MFLFFCFNLTFAQSNKEVRKYKIKSISEIVIDSTKNEFRESFYRFDKNGNIIFEEEFSKKKKFKLKNENRYNKKNQLVEQTVFNEKGEISQIIATVYDLKYPILVSIFDKNRNLISLTENKYNGFGEKIQEITKDNSGEILVRVEYEYNNKGLKMSKKTFNSKNTLIEEKKYSYEY